MMQFLRPEKSTNTGEYKTINELSQDSQNTILKAGQPFYDIKNNKLYIGDGVTQLQNLSPVLGASGATGSTGVAGPQGPTGAEGLSIFKSSEYTYTSSTSMKISSITVPEGRSIKVGDLIIGNPAYSYLYRVTAVSDASITVEYLNSIKGSIGNQGPTGPAGSFNIASDIQCASLTATYTVTAESFNARSDKRLKENIEPYKSKKSILDLPIYRYNYISDETKTPHIGCLAQDLQEICPELVHEDEEGFLSIEESKLVYLLLIELQESVSEWRKKASV